MVTFNKILFWVICLIIFGAVALVCEYAKEALRKRKHLKLFEEMKERLRTKEKPCKTNNL